MNRKLHTAKYEHNGSGRDVTIAGTVPRVRLQEIEELYRNAPVGLCVLDRDLRFVRINERMAEINGLPAAEHIGRCVRDVLPELADSVEPDMRQALATGEPRLDIEVSGTTPARPGVQRYWLEQWLPIHDDEGRVTGLNIVAEEITARRQIERDLCAANDELTQFNKAMVDRELRMIDLKKEVNALLTAAGRAPKYKVPEKSVHQSMSNEEKHDTHR